MMAENTLVAMGAVFVRMVLITTLAAFGLGITFIPRTWCGICPMGTLAAYIGRACARLRRMLSPFVVVLFGESNKNRLWSPGNCLVVRL